MRFVILLIIFLRFFLVLPLNAQSQMVQSEQLITLDVVNEPAESVLRKIDKQTSRGVSCPPELLEGAKRITLKVRNVSLEYVMTIFCEGQRFTYNIDEDFIILKPRKDVQVISAPLKYISLHGKIINQLLEPVADVLVTEMQDNQKRITSSLGEFYFDSIKVGSLLHFKGDNITIVPFRVSANRTSIQIKVEEKITTMPPVEVVHTGYQKITKRVGTGPDFVVNAESIQKRPSTNIVDRLEGLVPALVPITNKVAGTHQPTYFLIGGRTTLIASPDPLFIVDNFPFKGDLSMLNPDDIENITVLRDATAAGIWGARSANGVVVVTNKSAKFNRPLRISFNTFVSNTRIPDLFYSDRMSSADRITVDSILFKRGYYGQFINSPLHAAFSPVAEAFYNQSLSNADREALFDTWRKQDNRNDMKKYFYRAGISQHMSAQMSGGSGKNGFFVSLGYDWAHPELKLSKERRYTILAGNNYRPLTGLEITASLSYSENNHYNTEGVPEIPAPFQLLKDGNGNALFHPYNYRDTYTDTVDGGRLLNWKYSPMQEFEHRNNTLQEKDTRILASVKYENFPRFLRGLEAAVYMQREISEKGREDIYNRNSYLVRDLVNRFTQTSNVGIDRPIPWEDIVDRAGNRFTTDNYRYVLEYSRKWEGQTELEVMAGRDEIKTKGKLFTERIYGQRSYVFDYSHVYPMYYFPLLKEPIPFLNSERSTNTSYLSDYINGKYQWKGRYFFSTSYRQDQSSLFGAATNNKKIPLLSVGVGWNLSAEPFYTKSWLPFVKLRATYGSSGNTPSNVTAIQTFSNAGSNQNGDRVIDFNNPPLPSLRWEKVNTLNIGFNVQAAGDRIDVTVDWYSKKGRDLISYRSLDPTTGVTAMTGNVAAMASRNLDVILETKNIVREFQWRTGLLFSYVKEHVIHAEDKPQAAWMYCDREYFTVVPNRPLYGIYSFPFEGLSTNGDPLGPGKNKDYATLLLRSGFDSLIYHGRSSPSVFGSLTNEFKWKQFSLNVMLLYKFGYYFRRKSVNYYSIFDGTSQGSSDFARRWQKTGDENITNVPAFPESNDMNRDLFYNYSQALVERADHIRLHNINLAFDLERNALKKLGLRMANIYCNYSNVGIIWRANNYKIDPDKLSGYPQPAIFTIGVRGTLK